MQPLLRHVEQLINTTVNNPKLYQQAFMHKSYINERRYNKLDSNERLEFLGDAVLQIIVSDFLYSTYPEYPEGVLSRTRSQLVREPSLAILSRQNHFQDYIQLGRGEELSGGNDRDSILADTFEAFLGAIYLDQGIDLARDFVDRQMLTHHKDLLGQVAKDYKTLFQELVQQQGAVLIQYRILETTGPDHNKEFEVGLFVEDKLVAKGKGANKKQAENLAAKAAYNFMTGEDKHVLK